MAAGAYFIASASCCHLASLHTFWLIRVNIFSPFSHCYGPCTRWLHFFFLPIAAHLHGKAVKSGEKSYNLLIERRLFP